MYFFLIISIIYFLYYYLNKLFASVNASANNIVVSDDQPIKLCPFHSNKEL